MASGRPALPSNLPVITSAGDYRRQMAQPKPMIVAGTPFNPFSRPQAPASARPMNPIVSPASLPPTPNKITPANVVPQPKPVVQPNFAQPAPQLNQISAPPMTQFLQGLNQAPVPQPVPQPGPQPMPIQQPVPQPMPNQQPVAKPQVHIGYILQRNDGTWTNTLTGQDYPNGSAPITQDAYGVWEPTPFAPDGITVGHASGIMALAPQPMISSVQ